MNNDSNLISSNQVVPQNTNNIPNTATVINNDPPAQSPLKQRNFPKWVIIEIILVSLLILIIGLMFVIPLINEKLNTPAVPNLSSRKQISTTNWATFEGKSVGLSFKYPSDWHEVDDSNVSQTPVSKIDIDSINQGNKPNKKIINLVEVVKNPKKTTESTQYELNRFNKIKSQEINKKYDDGIDFPGSTVKLSDGKLSTGEEYVMFQNYEISNNDGDYGFNVIHIFINANKAFYFITLSFYNDSGISIFKKILSTLQISKDVDKPPELKKYENNVFSLTYPPDSIIGTKIEVNDNNDYEPVRGLGKDRRLGFVFKNEDDFGVPDLIINYSNQSEDFKGIANPMIPIYNKKSDTENLKNKLKDYGENLKIEDVNKYRRITFNDRNKKYVYLIKNDTVIEFLLQIDKVIFPNVNLEIFDNMVSSSVIK